MKHLYILIMLLLPFAMFAQEDGDTYTVPDFAEIEQDVNNPSSHYYYPKLFTRFCDGDTTLTPTEWERLYYGYSYQEDYDPYRDVKYNREKATDLYRKSNHTPEELDKIIHNAMTVLSDYPFELRQMKLLSYAYTQKGERENAAIWEHKLRQLLGVIISSGDGLSPESAWYVISSIHPYDVIYCFGLTPRDYTFVEPMYDFIEVENGITEGYYFNVSRIIVEHFRKQ
ncbi:MAG: DUF4919 domain-containing protein [Bacteroidales bacterium]|nr:DUF4919 domain-containing protein [Bacteroidales bacterium]